MAELIPDRLPQRASQGEKKLFSILQNLPDDYIGYYEPIIQNRYPDFVLICPDLGLMVIEVKGWYPANIIGADINTITIKERENRIQHKHPLRQARDYMCDLMDACRNRSQCQTLINNKVPHVGKFVFPFGHFAVLSNITSDQMKKHELGDLTSVFDPSRVVPRDVFLGWEELGSEQLRKLIKSFFNPFWEFPKLNKGQVDKVRAIIHPEIVITPSGPKVDQDVALKVLDAKQENNARNIGNGHRLIYGVAGSGKTVLLISRAKICAQDPETRVLVLCFNVSLAAYLKKAFQGFPNIETHHFDGWAKKNGIARKMIRNKVESNLSLGDRLLSYLQEGYGDCQAFDSVLIDEAQDFEGNWFKCALAAMKEPLDGDLLIVGDGGQGLYPRGHVSWKSINVQATGRTVYRKFDLDKNYRNSKEILEVAALFASDIHEDDDDINSIPVSPELAIRTTGFKPMLIRCGGREEEANKAIEIALNLISGKWGAQDCASLLASEIGIFYPLLRQSNRKVFNDFLRTLREQAPAVWLNDPEDRSSRQRIDEGAIKVQTIHSAKGLQYPAVILMWADELPRKFEDVTSDIDRKLMYVALTRPENFLAITHSGPSIFIDDLYSSGRVQVP